MDMSPLTPAGSRLAALAARPVLEPASLYGLYQYPRFKALAGKDGTLPVLRVVRPQGAKP